ncbi:hypothetical protein PCN061_p213 (plasmid) [Escherichia coli PCN061]|nr:hypothetical protein PCN061_p213 [Escherichia coli PCN061]
MPSLTFIPQKSIQHENIINKKPIIFNELCVITQKPSTSLTNISFDMILFFCQYKY